MRPRSQQPSPMSRDPLLAFQRHADVMMQRTFFLKYDSTRATPACVRQRDKVEKEGKKEGRRCLLMNPFMVASINQLPTDRPDGRAGLMGSAARRVAGENPAEKILRLAQQFL